MRVPHALALALVLALPVLAPLASPAAVAPVAGKLPQAIVGAAGVRVDGVDHVLGGRLGSGYFVDTVLRATPGGAIETAATLPTAPGESPGRYSGRALYLDGMIYYFGGTTLKRSTIPGQQGEFEVPTATADIIRVDPRTGQATILTQDKLARPAFGLAAVEHRGRAYLFGGFDLDVARIDRWERLDSITVFDPRAPAGSRVTVLPAQLPFPVQDAGAIVLNNRVYLLGGLSDNDNATNRCVPEPDYVPACSTNKIVTWAPELETTPPRVVGELPYRTHFAQAATVDGKGYLIGGLLTDGTASSSILEIAPSGNTGLVSVRVLVPTLPQGVFGAATATDGRNVTLYGGRVEWRDDIVLDSVLRVEPGPTAPWPPRNATATQGTLGVRLSWDPPRYDGETVVSSYQVYRSTAGGNATLVGTTSNLAFDDPTACPGVESIWKITALNARGESDGGTQVAFTPEASAPPAPRNVTAYGGNAQVVVRWQPPLAECEVPISGYTVLRDGFLVARLGPQLEYRDTRDVVNGRAYSYQIRAYNARGDGPVSEVARAFPAEVPGSPHSLFVSALNGSVQLTWSPPEDAVSYYLVSRSFTPGSQGQTVGNVTTTSFTDTGVERGRTYFYTVRAVNIAGQSPPSEVVPASLVRKPGPPTDVTALGRPGEVLVTWQAPIDTGDAPASVVRYYVTRSGGGSANPIIVKTDIETLAFHDRNVTPGQSYTYTVTTLNPLSSVASAEASATPLPAVNSRPNAVLSAFPSVGLANEPIEFDASQSNDADGTIREYIYDFGDGTEPARTDRSFVTHSYHQNGTYTATLVVRDERGAESPVAQVRVLVGDVAPAEGIDTTGGLGGPTRVPTAPTSRPGEETPESPVPGPGVAALVAALALLALGRRRRP